MMPDFAERDRLYAENERLVWHYLNTKCGGPRGKYVERIGGWEDAAQVCRMGLLKAAATYAPEQGQFSTWAFIHMRQAVQNAMRSGGLLHIPPSAWHRETTRPLAVKAAQAPASLSQQSPDATYDGLHGQVVARRLEVEQAPEPPTDWGELQAQVSRLSSRQQLALRLRYWDELTLEEVGKELGGICKERVRQIVEVALQRLHRELRRQREGR